LNLEFSDLRVSVPGGTRDFTAIADEDGTCGVLLELDRIDKDRGFISFAANGALHAVDSQQDR
jgi:hypothetical protein